MSIDQNDIIVSSWSDLCERLYENSWQKEIGRFRSNNAFRGVSDKGYNLATSLKRNCGENTDLEYHLLRNFQKYAQLEDADPTYSDWHWMTLAQHHGLPTRLLDWTYSPFVAVHFATAETGKYDRDAAIWFVDFVKVNRLLPGPLSDTLNQVGANAFTLRMMEKAVPDIETFDNLSGEDLVLFFEPPSLNSRIVNQFAFFSVMSNPASDLHTWLFNHPEVYGRIIIPKELKWEVRDKLDQANITERILFPGLDGIASWQARHYKPRQGL
jgi:hypothetical protein